jgi:hypothetical protein
MHIRSGTLNIQLATKIANRLIVATLRPINIAKRYIFTITFSLYTVRMRISNTQSYGFRG